MTSARVIALDALILVAIACGGSESSSTDAGVDATIVDSSKDTLVADSAARPDVNVTDAGIDAADDAPDAPCAINVVAAASCHYDAGICFEYVGSGWNPGNVSAGCSPEAGTSLVWDAGCPTLGRIGSCGVTLGALELVERCYPPFSSNQCQGLCLIIDGGYCPN